ncbi:MAG: ABC transporter permease [Deltaproteobacteria bacterium]|jgi:NitT/TauT family transport system permease protein|nr:ABC transporter permease [Deltaproteobacteria bacterium]
MAAFWRKYACIFVFLGGWELLSRTGALNQVFFPPFSTIVDTIWRMCLQGVMLTHVKVSLTRALTGFVIAAAVGVPLGLVLGFRHRGLQKTLDIPFEVLSQVNPFLLFHILILFLGIDEAPKITIVAWTCLWPILFSSMNGAASVNPILVKAGRAFGLKRLGLIRKVVLPASSALVFAGIRLSLGYSMFMLIAAEMMGASRGLGWLTLTSQETFQLNRMYASVVVIAFLGLILDGAVWLAGKRLLQLHREGYLNAAD